MKKLRYCVYVLLSLKDHKFYIGFTENLKERLTDHFHGQSSATSPRRPFILTFCEYFIVKSDALRRERYFKTTAGKKALKLMLRDNLKDNNYQNRAYFRTVPNHFGKKSYGVPGREIRKGETIGQAVKRNIKEEFGRNVLSYKIICVNSNYYNGHFIGIGVVVEMDGEPELLKKEDWEKWEWFDKEKFPQNLFPPAKNLVDCYLSNKICVSE